jgi:hypothetical protein
MQTKNRQAITILKIAKAIPAELLTRDVRLPREEAPIPITGETGKEFSLSKLTKCLHSFN